MFMSKYLLHFIIIIYKDLQALSVYIFYIPKNIVLVHSLYNFLILYSYDL